MGAGLHVGHPLGYIATDTFARFNRMLGKNVLHTLGYDAFGLPAEQYAIQTGTHPAIKTQESIELLTTLEEGQTVPGVVKNITEYGVFIDLGGLDGLLHITDMSWKRIRHPREMVHLGDELQLKVLSFIEDRKSVV